MRNFDGEGGGISLDPRHDGSASQQRLTKRGVHGKRQSVIEDLESQVSS